MHRYIPKYNFFYKRVFIQPVIDLLQDVDGRVLDVGCGDGLEIRTIARKEPKLSYFGIDKDRKAIAKAKKLNEKINFQVGNAEKLPYPNSYFSLVYSLEVLEHVNNPDLVFKEVKRVLKPGGKFFFTTPLEGDKNNFYGILYQKFNYDPHRELFGHIQKFSYLWLKKKIEKHGFKVVRVNFAAFYLNQLYSISLKVLKSLFGQKVGKIFLPLTFFVSIVTGFETMLFKTFPWGLNMQLTCKKE